jgi:hypothetical protein
MLAVHDVRACVAERDEDDKIVGECDRVCIADLPSLQEARNI